MPDIVYYVAASLDGYIATPDGGVAWLAPFEASGEDYGYAAFYESVDGLFLGRQTYEQSLTFGPWPYKGKPAWVFSHRSLDATADVTMTADLPEQVAAQATALGLRRVWLVGGAALASSFRARGLITEYIVSVMPVILGGGVPLLAEPGDAEALRLLESTRYDDGVVQLRYVRA